MEMRRRAIRAVQNFVPTNAFHYYCCLADFPSPVESKRRLVGTVRIELLFNFTKSHVFTVLPTVNHEVWEIIGTGYEAPKSSWNQLRELIALTACPDSQACPQLVHMVHTVAMGTPPQTIPMLVFS